MMNSISPALYGNDKTEQPSVDISGQSLVSAEKIDIGKRLEQMLWAEMLSHAGLEKAFTQAGGESASAFSRYIVEAIAEDLADKHPMGIGQSATPDQRNSGALV